MSQIKVILVHRSVPYVVEFDPKLTVPEFKQLASGITGVSPNNMKILGFQGGVLSVRIQLNEKPS